MGNISSKIKNKFFSLIEDSREFYKDFLSREPRNSYIPEIYLSMKEFQYLNEKLDEIMEIKSSFDLNPTEYDLIYHIGKSDSINITQLSKKMKSSKGYVSKIIKKLLLLNIVETRQLPSNKKEVFIYLTKAGNKLYLELYRFYYQKENDIEMFMEDNFSDAELKVIFKFFTNINKFNNEQLLKAENKKEK